MGSKEKRFGSQIVFKCFQEMSPKSKRLPCLAVFVVHFCDFFGHSNFAQTVTSVLHWHFLENIDGSFYIQRAACASLGVGKPNFPAYQAWMDFAPPTCTTNVPKADSERTRFVFTATS